MYLVINVLEELFGPKNPASALDFGGGEGDWKAILSNRSWREAPVHVFAPTYRGLYLNFLWNAPAMINVWAKNILNRTNLMARVKKNGVLNGLTKSVNSKKDENRVDGSLLIADALTVEAKIAPQEN